MPSDPLCFPRSFQTLGAGFASLWSSGCRRPCWCPQAKAASLSLVCSIFHSPTHPVYPRGKQEPERARSHFPPQGCSAWLCYHASVNRAAVSQVQSRELRLPGTAVRTLSSLPRCPTVLHLCSHRFLSLRGCSSLPRVSFDFF